MSDAFDLGLRLKSREAVAADAASIEDEKMALESIYGDTFTELIVNKSWQMKFFLPHLLKYLPQDSGPAKSIQVT
jgi:hypothetical protein